MEHGGLRTFSWLSFFALILWAWWVMYSRVTDMGRVPMNMRDFGPLVAMWAIMMAAMMGPTFVPSLKTYEDLMVSANGTRAGWVGLIVGYFIAWIGFAILIAALQVILVEIRLITSMGRSMSLGFSFLLLLAAGLYQFTPLKERCLTHCRTPMMQFLAHWRTGFSGGIVMGLHHGAYCVACCWGLMAIGFVGGVMDLIWMGGATVLMTLEKLPALGRWLTRPIGLALLIWAGYVGLKLAGITG